VSRKVARAFRSRALREPCKTMTSASMGIAHSMIGWQATGIIDHSIYFLEVAKLERRGKEIGLDKGGKARKGPERVVNRYS